MMDHVHVLNHPLIQHKLSILRSKNTSVKGVPGAGQRNLRPHVL